MRTAQQKFNIRRQRVRKKLLQITDRLRLIIHKSNMHLYTQIIDDEHSNTLVSASTTEKSLKKLNKSNCNKESAAELGKLLAERAIKKGITTVVFDRGGYKYHGIVKTFADIVREKLDF